MKRQIMTFLMVFALAMGTALWAQSTGTTQPLPPSQQVDQSGEPETGTGLDVDVDAGRNAEDGVVDVEVNRNTDSDTAAQGNDPNRRPVTGTGPDVDVDAGRNAEDGVMDVEVNRNTDSDTDAQGNDPAVAAGTYADVDNDNDSLPETAGNGPLFALLGLLSLAGAFVVRMIR